MPDAEPKPIPEAFTAAEIGAIAQMTATRDARKSMERGGSQALG